jgi:iron-sulfur cluster repair protein YtfE (RIC family)
MSGGRDVGLTEKTVGELAVENPAAARVFERHGIDYPYLVTGGKLKGGWLLS